MNSSKHISKTFLFFLFVSTLIWLVINLSKTYVYNLPLEISYVDLPSDKILINKPKKECLLRVQAKGVALLFSKFNNKNVQISLKNLKRKNDDFYYLLLNDSKYALINQLTDNIKLLAIETDSVHFQLKQLKSKKVPIKPVLKVNYALGFDMSELLLEPDSVAISGTSQELEQINFIESEPVLLDQVSQSFEKKIKLIYKKLDSKNVKIHQSYSNLKMKVDKFTEGEISLPILIENLPENVKITTYPKEVLLKYKVALKNFEKVSSSSFKIIADYDFTKINGLDYMILKVNTSPSFVSSLRLVPSQVSFLIHK